MNNQLTTDPNELEQAEKARNEALENLRADYAITRDTRLEAGVQVPEYAHWLEDRVLMFESLVRYYQQKQTPPTPLDGDDGLRLCKVCKDRYATRGDGICRLCYEQIMIDKG